MDMERIGPASREINDLLIAAYQGPRGVHAETVIGAAAALTGEWALRASGGPLPDKGYVFGGLPDPLLYQAEDEGQVSLWWIIRSAAEEAGAEAGELPDIIDVVRRTAAAVGSDSYPALSVPDENFPQEWSPNACPRFRAEIERIREAHDLTVEEIALALGFSTALLVDMTKGVLAPHIAAKLAVEIMIGTSRLAPLADELG